MEDNQNGLPALSRAVSSRDGVMASEFMQNPNWLSFCAAIESPGDSAMGSTFSSSEFGTATSRCAFRVRCYFCGLSVRVIFGSLNGDRN